MRIPGAHYVPINPYGQTHTVYRTPLKFAILSSSWSSLLLNYKVMSSTIAWYLGQCCAEQKLCLSFLFHRLWSSAFVSNAKLEFKKKLSTKPQLKIESFRLRVSFKASTFLCMINQARLQWGHSNSTSQTTKSHSGWVVSYECIELSQVCPQYPIVSSPPSAQFCSWMQPIDFECVEIKI